MGDVPTVTCPMTDKQTDLIIQFMAKHSMVAAHQLIGNNGAANRQTELDKLKTEVDKYGPKKTVVQIEAHWNYLKASAKKYNSNKGIYKRLTGNPVDKTFLRDDKYERVLEVVGTSHKNGLHLTTELGLPKVRLMTINHPLVQSIMNPAAKPPALKAVLKSMQKENSMVLNNRKKLSSMEVYVIPTSTSSNKQHVTRHPLKQIKTVNTIDVPNTHRATVTSSSTTDIPCLSVPQLSTSKLSNCNDLGLHTTNKARCITNIAQKEKTVMKRNRPPKPTANLKTMNYSKSIDKSLEYSQYGHMHKKRQYVNAELTEVLQQNLDSINSIQAELKIQNDLKRRSIEMKEKYYEEKIRFLQEKK